MKEFSTIGLDLAKNVFHVHGVDREEKVVAPPPRHVGTLVQRYCMIDIVQCFLFERHDRSIVLV